jgi:precorrin-2/cobalt-factor-2 C20-methyltransferase
MMFGVGVGPGDPELLTVKAARLLGDVPVVAYFAKKREVSNARTTAAGFFSPRVEELPLFYPYTTELSPREAAYASALGAFYDEAAALLAERLDGGQNVAVLCEGDPLFYGSYMYLHDRLAFRYACRVVPGITSFAGCAAVAGIPLVSKEQIFSVIPGTLSEEDLALKLGATEAAAIIKLGRHFGKVRRVLESLGRLEGATYFERGTTDRQIMMPLKDRGGEASPYFSLIIVPGHGALPSQALDRIA